MPDGLWQRPQAQAQASPHPSRPVSPEPQTNIGAGSADSAMALPLRMVERCVPPAATAWAKVRTALLATFERSAPTWLFHATISPTLTHILAPMVALSLIAAVTEVTGTLTVFAFHPIFMALGFITFMSEALLVYRNGVLVSTFGPIMAGSHKANARAIHVTLQIVAAVFATVGLIFVVANKVRLGKSIVPGSTHAWCGTLCLLLVAVQVAIGTLKVKSSPVPAHRWHGTAGKLTYDAAMVAVLTGSTAFLPVTLFNTAVQMAVVLLWLSTQLQHGIGERKSAGAEGGPPVDHASGGGGDEAASGTLLGSGGTAAAHDAESTA